MSTENKQTQFKAAMERAIKKAINQYRKDGTVAVAIGMLHSKVSRELLGEPSAPKGTNASRLFFDMILEVLDENKKLASFVI